MRTFILCLLLILAAMPTFAQKTATLHELEQRGADSIYYDIYTDQPFTGILQDMTTNTNEYMSIEMVNGVAHGYFRGYYDRERTRIKWETQYVMGKKQGRYRAWFDNGDIEFKARLKNDQLHGTRRCYFYSNGKVWHIHHYKDGGENGVRKTFWPNGRLQSKATYRNDELTGPYRSYYESGKLHVKAVYANGILDGPYESYHENGNMAEQGQYENGEAAGQWKQYDESGKLDFTY